MPYADPEVQKLYDKQKYQKNKEKILEGRKRYYELNKAEITAKQLAYQRAHQDERNVYHREWRKNQTEESKVRYTEKAKEWRRSNPRKVLATVARYQLNHPWETVAHAAVNAAVRVGLLIRPETCSKCGKFCKPHAHHADYSDLLEVIWLCPKCHKQVHLSQ